MRVVISQFSEKGVGLTVTAALVDDPAEVVPVDVFDLDVQVETERVRHATMGCQTDDGCGQTCQISACHSQK